MEKVVESGERETKAGAEKRKFEGESLSKQKQIPASNCLASPLPTSIYKYKAISLSLIHCLSLAVCWLSSNGRVSIWDEDLNYYIFCLAMFWCEHKYLLLIFIKIHQSLRCSKKAGLSSAQNLDYFNVVSKSKFHKINPESIHILRRKDFSADNKQISLREIFSCLCISAEASSLTLCIYENSSWQMIRVCSWNRTNKI